MWPIRRDGKLPPCAKAEAQSNRLNTIPSIESVPARWAAYSNRHLSAMLRTADKCLDAMHEKGMNIRLATIDDLSILAEMNYMLIKDEGHSNPMGLSELRERMDEWLQGEYVAAVIEKNSEVIGYSLWRSEKQQHIYVRQFFVAPGHRRKHVGKKAIQLLKTTYWKGMLLRLEVLVDNQRGRLFWKSVGFSEYCLTMECRNA